MEIFPNKKINRSQSHILSHSKNNIKNNLKVFDEFVKDNVDIFKRGNKLFLPPITSRKKSKVKLNMVYKNIDTIYKNIYLDNLFKKIDERSPEENGKKISNKLNILFNKNKLLDKKKRNKSNIFSKKRNLSSIEQIKLRNREKRKIKEKQENELFEMRQREAKKLMASFKVELDENNKMRRQVGKRYSIFKEILIYLESNNITLSEMLKNDPFQHQAYQIPNSYEFFNAIKVGNYDYVIKALNDEPRYLFSIDYFGQTPYHWAAKLGDLKMTKILIDYGPYLNQKDYKGRTPVYIGAINNHKEVCSYLLSKGGNCFLKDKNGLMPVDAVENPEMKSLLLDYMAQPFSNPIYKARIKEFLRLREEKIEQRKQKEEKEKKNAELMKDKDLENKNNKNINVENREEKKDNANEG